MKILLDENFPLALVRELQQQGHEVEHIILLGLRGIPDATIIDRLNCENLLFLTHDQELRESASYWVPDHSLASKPKFADRCPGQDLARRNS